MQKNNKIHQKMRERKREITFFCVGKLAQPMNGKRIGMRRAKNKSKIKEQRKSDIKVDRQLAQPMSDKKNQNKLPTRQVVTILRKGCKLQDYIALFSNIFISSINMPTDTFTHIL